MEVHLLLEWFLLKYNRVFFCISRCHIIIIIMVMVVVVVEVVMLVVIVVVVQ